MKLFQKNYFIFFKLFTDTLLKNWKRRYFYKCHYGVRIFKTDVNHWLIYNQWQKWLVKSSDRTWMIKLDTKHSRLVKHFVFDRKLSSSCFLSLQTIPSHFRNRCLRPNKATVIIIIIEDEKQIKIEFWLRFRSFWQEKCLAAKHK